MLALNIIIVLVGIVLAAWFALVAYDVSTDYRRFDKFADRRPEVKRQKTDSSRSVTKEGRTKEARPKEVV